MSTSHKLPVLAALVGAAALASAETSHATERVERGADASVVWHSPAASEETEARASVAGGQGRESAGSPTLATLLAEQARWAADHKRHDDVAQMGELWLTLHRRGQLDRSVEHGEGYLRVALRHQQASAYRSDARASRFRSLEPSAFDSESLAALGGSPLSIGTPDEAVDAQHWLETLEEPYRTAVALSLQGCSRREVAAEMGVADATVRKWMQRLRERLGDTPWQ